MKTHILLLDDDANIKAFVTDGLSSLDPTIFYANNIATAVKILETEDVDVAILDVHLGFDESGADIAKLINDQYHIPFLFLTAHSDDMVSGILKQYDAYSHLVKPVNPKQLLLDVKGMINGVDKPKEDVGAISVRTGGERIVLRFNEILYIEAEGNYSRMVTYLGKYPAAKTLKTLSKSLPKGLFIRTNRSYLVNIEAIRKVSADKIELVNGHVLPVSRSYYKNLLKHFNNL